MIPRWSLHGGGIEQQRDVAGQPGRDRLTGFRRIRATASELLWEEIKRFESWQPTKEFLCTLMGRYVFPGMPNADYNLETTLDRHVRYHYPESEAILIESFKKAVPSGIHEPPPDDDLFSWLALMRHYGLPSRLLDCTESPPVAAYFATEPSSNDCCDFAIWAIDRDALQRSAEVILGILSSGRPLSPIEIGSLFAPVFKDPKRFVALADAKQKTARQTAQMGLFLCPGDPAYPFWRNLHGIPAGDRTAGFMYKMVLPGSARREVLEDLAHEDINRAHLLPDIDEIESLCTRLRNLLSESQKEYGHLQWRVAVRPILMKHGLLEVEQVPMPPSPPIPPGQS